MAHRAARTHPPMPGTWLRPLGPFFASLIALAVVTGCGAADEPEGVGKLGEKQDSQPTAIEATQTGRGRITTYAGSGNPRFSGDGGPAREAGFYQPTGVALDGQGNLYLASDNRVRKIDSATGVISTVGGTGRNRSQGDGGPSAEAALAEPNGLAFDSTGNLFLVESGSGRIRRIDAATGIITTIAGGGIGNPRKKIFGDGGPAIEALIKLPTDVAVDGEGNLYIATDNRVRKVDVTSGVITTFAGIGERGLEGDGGPATSAGLAEPVSIAIDGEGNLFIADRDNHRVRKVDGSSGIITTVAGIGEHSERRPDAYRGVRTVQEQRIGTNSRESNREFSADQGLGYSGDGGPATEAMLAFPKGVALDRYGNLFIAEGSVRVRRVDAATNVMATVASDQAVQTYAGGKVQVVTATFGELSSIAINNAGEIFLADYKNNVVHKVLATAAP